MYIYRYNNNNRRGKLWRRNWRVATPLAPAGFQGYAIWSRPFGGGGWRTMFFFPPNDDGPYSAATALSLNNIQYSCVVHNMYYYNIFLLISIIGFKTSRITTFTAYLVHTKFTW